MNFLKDSSMISAKMQRCLHVARCIGVLTERQARNMKPVDKKEAAWEKFQHDIEAEMEVML